jgi:regulator of protease activity HflC (stomatin/prohibitin superfamily)
MQFLPDAAYPNEGDTVQAVTNAVTHVAVALDELKDQLEIANRRVGEVAAAQITEAELGRLFVRAAQFADTAIAEAEDEARQLVAAGASQAEQIVADARREADAIIEEAHRAARLGVAAAEQVQTTIDGFTRVNRELIKELEFLRDIIQPELTAGAASPGLAAGSSPGTPAPAASFDAPTSFTSTALPPLWAPTEGPPSSPGVD